PDSEQAGMLARQQEIANLGRELKAQQLLADEARSAASRAESAYQQMAQAVPVARQRSAEVTSRHHSLQLEYERLTQQAAQSEEQMRRLAEERAELDAQEEELRIQREEAEARFEALDGELAEKQEVFAQREMALESLQADVER